MFHHSTWAVGSCSSGPPAGGTTQILVNSTKVRKEMGHPCTELRKVFERGCKIFLSGPAWLLLSKTYKDFFSALYMVLLGQKNIACILIAQAHRKTHTGPLSNFEFYFKALRERGSFRGLISKSSKTLCRPFKHAFCPWISK